MLQSILEKLGMNNHTNAVATIRPQEAYSDHVNGDVVLIDVREAIEWSQTGCPQGCKRIALGRSDFVQQVIKAVNSDINSPIAVCCKSGMRGEKAARLLNDAGFQRVTNVEGGIMDWIAHELPVEAVSPTN